jgi:hypothetical protein
MFKYEKDYLFKNLVDVQSPDEIKDAYVVINGSFAYAKISNWREKLPSFAIHPPSNWKLMKVINGPKIMGEGLYEPKIYYSPP